MSKYHYGEEALHYTDPKEFKNPWGQWCFTAGFSSIDKAVGYPEGGDGCHWYGDKLEEAGVVTKSVKTDHEMCGCYFYFKTKRAAISFLKRLNQWIDKRIEMVEALR